MFKIYSFAAFKYKRQGSYKYHVYCVNLRLTEYLYDNKRVDQDVVVCTRVDRNADKGMAPQALLMSKAPVVYNVAMVVDPPDYRHYASGTHKPEYMELFDITTTVRPAGKTGEKYY